MNYCFYCARMVHRCECANPDSPLSRFLALAVPPKTYQPHLRATPYKRGVPPQIKRRERAVMRNNYKHWYSGLVSQYSERCMHCGSTENLVIDHVIPVAKGGKSELENLQLLCAVCNSAKGKLIYDCRPDTFA